MTPQQRRNRLIIAEFNQMLGTQPVMNIYYQLAERFFLSDTTIRNIIRLRQQPHTTGKK